MQVQNIVAGCRVRHNYKDGHGQGTVMSMKDDAFNRPLGFEVAWDSGVGTFSYSHTGENQEIVLAEVRS
jgi:hypothetical protein